MSKKIILFELNEVPYRVLDDFCARHPQSTFSKILSSCDQFETISEDVGNLSPWITWPSLHRGVKNTLHNIGDFGEDLQNIDKKFPPIWSILSSHDIKVGIFGSLHTYPLPKEIDKYSFYVPDSFARNSECIPHYLHVFQEFLLKMSRASARNVKRKIEYLLLFNLIINIKKVGIRQITIIKCLLQILSEFIDSGKIIRRRTFASILSFDVFMKQLVEKKPQFVTFFTNHVASSMHRYWSASYPGDYDDFDLDPAWIKTYRKEIDFSMKAADNFLHSLVNFVHENPDYSIWVATSMGQSSTETKNINTQLSVIDMSKFMRGFGLESNSWEAKPAMHPQVNVVVSRGKTEYFAEKLNKTLIGGVYTSYRQKGNFFSIDLGHIDLGEEKGVLKINNGLDESDPNYHADLYSLEDFGLVNFKIQEGTMASAYHIPQGCLLIYNYPADSHKKRQTISTLDIAPAILQNYSISIPHYMHKQNLLNGSDDDVQENLSLVVNNKATAVDAK
ncbi:MAG: hypothetical protein VX354_00330 [Pseudomonadota bacterium]